LVSLEENLKFHGFTRIEAKVYIKLLEMNYSKVSELGKITEITRTQLYPLLKNMVEKGYIKQIETKPVSYEALNPDELIKVLKYLRKKQINQLSELKSELNKIKPVHKIEGAPYKVYLIKNKNNITKKLIELWSSVRKEVVLTTAFERDLFEKSIKLMKIRKEKAKKGIKTTIYLSLDPENLYMITKLDDFFKDVNFGGIVKKSPYTTVVFDRKHILVIFFNAHKKDYDTAFYFENHDLANTFASKNMAPIESYPLKGELRLTTIGGERELIIPPVIDLISKEEQYKLGYGAGWYGIKSFKKKNYNMKTLILILETQMIINGWGKAKSNYKKNEVTLILENAIVPSSFIKGSIEGFLSIIGDFVVKEKESKKDIYEFTIKLK